MRFGPLAIEGLERLDPAYVAERLRWQSGQIYDASKVEETRRALIESGLFSTVQITAFEVEKANVVQLANVNSITAAQRTQHYELVGVPA